MMDLSESEETELQKRDERVLKAILSRLEDLDDEIHRGAFAGREKAKIIETVNNERWFELSDMLSSEDIDSLCDISPTRLLDE